MRRSRWRRTRGKALTGVVAEQETEHQRHQIAEKTEERFAIFSAAGCLSCFRCSLLGCGFYFLLRDFCLIVLITHVRNVHPGVTHFVYSAIAKTNPLVRIGIILVPLRVVVPGSDF